MIATAMNGRAMFVRRGSTRVRASEAPMRVAPLFRTGGVC
jgi:hypothetical protein